MAVTAVDGHKGAQKSQRVDPVGLHPTRASIDLQAGRVKYPALDTNLGQRACQPEAVISRLIAYKNACKVLRRCSQPAGKLGKVAARYSVNARLVAVRPGDADDPALLAELNGRIDRDPGRLVPVCRIRHRRSSSD